MSKQKLLKQAQKDAEFISRLSILSRELLDRETDWHGSRLYGYFFDEEEIEVTDYKDSITLIHQSI